MPAQAKSHVIEARARLAGTTLPAGLDPAERALLNAAIDEAFVESFRLIMLTAAAMALLGAFFAAVMIRPAEAATRLSAPGGR